MTNREIISLLRAGWLTNTHWRFLLEYIEDTYGIRYSLGHEIVAERLYKLLDEQLSQPSLLNQLIEKRKRNAK